MDYIEIVLINIDKKYLSKIIRNNFKFEINDIISSHFFDKKHNKDIEYQGINTLEDCFWDSGTGNLFLEKVKMGIELEKALILFNFDEEVGDITINLCESQFISNKSSNLYEKIEKLFQTLYELQKKYTIDKIVVGYEPVTDDDMKMAELYQGHIKIYNERIFKSPFAQSLYYALRGIVDKYH